MQVHGPWQNAPTSAMHKILIVKLFMYGLEEQTMKWTENWLKGQAQKVVVSSANFTWCKKSSNTEVNSWREDGATLLLIMPSARTGGYGHKLELKRFHQETLYNAGDGTLEKLMQWTYPGLPLLEILWMWSWETFMRPCLSRDLQRSLPTLTTLLWCDLVTILS